MIAARRVHIFLPRDPRVAEIAQSRVNPEPDTSLQQIFHGMEPKWCLPFEQTVEHRHVVACKYGKARHAPAQRDFRIAPIHRADDLVADPQCRFEDCWRVDTARRCEPVDCMLRERLEVRARGHKLFRELRCAQ